MPAGPTAAPETLVEGHEGRAMLSAGRSVTLGGERVGVRAAHLPPKLGAGGGSGVTGRLRSARLEHGVRGGAPMARAARSDAAVMGHPRARSREPAGALGSREPPSASSRRAPR